MAAASQAIAAGDLTSRAANKPLVVGKNLLEIAYGLGAAQLVTNQVGTLAAGDTSAAGFDRRLLTDRFHHTLWKANAAGATHYICLDQGATALEWVDTFAIFHGGALAGVNVVVEADTVTPVVPWAGATTVWAAFALGAEDQVLKLQPANQYQARFWRITLSKGAAFTPQAAHIWLGSNVQFPVKADGNPYIPTAAALAANVEVKTGRGIRQVFIKHRLLGARKQVFTIPDAPEGTFLTNLRDFWNNTRSRGAHAPFLYCEDPTAAPNEVKLVYSTDPRFDVSQPIEGASYVTKLALQTMEQGGR